MRPLGLIGGISRRLVLTAAIMFTFVGRASASTVVSVTLNPDTLIGGATSTATVTLDSPAAAGGVTISLTSTNTSAKVPATLPVSAGQTSATFSVATTDVDSQVVAFVSATLGTSTQKAALTINPVSLTSVGLSPATTVGGYPVAGTVTLSGPAPKGGVKVQLESSDSTVGVPSSVTVQEGQSSATFAVSSKRLAAPLTVTITATLGFVSTTASVVLSPMGPASISLDPASVKATGKATGTITLTGPAPAGGLVIDLSSNNRAANVPGNVKLAAGALTATFVVTTHVVGLSAPCTITAKYGSVLQTGTLTVEGPGLATITLNPTTVTGTSPTSGIVALAEPAPPGGLTIQLSSDQPTVIVPATVTIPTGKKVATFNVKTTGVPAQTVANIKATLNSTTPTAPLTINAPTLVSVVLKPSIVTGVDTATATVTISSPAPDAGLPITVTSDQKSAVIPAKISIGGGKKTVSFAIKTTKVAAQTTAVITVTLGSGTQTANLIIN